MRELNVPLAGLELVGSLAVPDPEFVEGELQTLPDGGGGGVEARRRALRDSLEGAMINPVQSRD